MDNNEQRKGGNNYDTLQSIVEQLEFCGYVTADTNHELKDNAAFKALKELAAVENKRTMHEGYYNIEISGEAYRASKDPNATAIRIPFPDGIIASLIDHKGMELKRIKIRILPTIKDAIRLGFSNLEDQPNENR